MEVDSTPNLIFLTTHQIGREKYSKRLIGAAASTRLRAIIPAEYLSVHGFTTQIISLHHTVWKGERINVSPRAVIVVSKILTDSAVKEVVRLKSLGVRTIFDFCDNYFDGGEYEEVSHNLLAIAEEVVVNTYEMSFVIRKYNKTCQINVIEDPIEGNVVEPKFPYSTGPLNILLFGSRLVAKHFEIWINDINELSAIRPIKIEVLTQIDEGLLEWERTISKRLNPRVSLTLTLWNEYQLQYCFRRSDLVLIPSTYDPFNITKSANRLVESVVAGLPTIAYPLVCYLPFSYLLPVSENLVPALRYIMSSPDVVLSRVKEAQILAKAMYCREFVGEKWKAIIFHPGAEIDRENVERGNCQSSAPLADGSAGFFIEFGNYDSMLSSIKTTINQITGFDPNLLVSLSIRGLDSFSHLSRNFNGPITCLYKPSVVSDMSQFDQPTIRRILETIAENDLITETEINLTQAFSKQGFTAFPMVSPANLAYTLLTRLHSILISRVLKGLGEQVDLLKVVVRQVSLGILTHLAICHHPRAPVITIRPR